MAGAAARTTHNRRIANPSEVATKRSLSEDETYAHVGTPRPMPPDQHREGSMAMRKSVACGGMDHTVT